MPCIIGISTLNHCITTILGYWNCSTDSCKCKPGSSTEDRCAPSSQSIIDQQPKLIPPSFGAMISDVYSARGNAGASRQNPGIVPLTYLEPVMEYHPGERQTQYDEQPPELKDPLRGRTREPPANDSVNRHFLDSDSTLHLTEFGDPNSRKCSSDIRVSRNSWENWCDHEFPLSP
ncbi:hypothetical protein BDV40DRAFT_299315 [Aspergillus tamarii]|uniref:Uncharacterized protein n=1 Tax=Aspergillus tamarii TaxID=41984 RepID=A0A5N6UY40_ASPTM|nr:hypothetical protein BDV40DRAFT_299315 [Aspergillus tamarii]